GAAESGPDGVANEDEAEAADESAASNDDAAAEEEVLVEEVDGVRQNLTTFDGEGGPVLANAFTKLLYALKFQSMEILLSGAVVDGSQILYDRNPIDRVQKVAPYLT